MFSRKIAALQQEIRDLSHNPVFRHRGFIQRSEVQEFDYSFINPQKRVNNTPGLKMIPAQKAKELPEDRIFPENSDLFFDKNYALSEKMDGGRGIVHTNINRANRIYGRPKGEEKIIREFTDNFFHLRDFIFEDLGKTIFDGEIVAAIPVRVKDSETKAFKNSDQMGSSSSLILRNNPFSAWRDQEKSPADYYIFDVMQYRGRDLKSWVWQDRHEQLLEIFAKHRLSERFPNIRMIPFLDFEASDIERMRFFIDIILKGGEGIVGNNRKYKYIPDGRHSKNVRKLKKVSPYDVQITGIIAGKSGNIGRAGGFEVSGIINGQLTRIGQVNIRGDDTNRDVVQANPEKYLGRIIEILVFEWTDKSIKSGVAAPNRHAQSKHIDDIFIFRDDKSEPEDLTDFFAAAKKMRGIE